jgi:uncharacterized membrane protein
LKLGFQEKPWDLYITLIYTEVATAIMIGLGTGTLGGLLLVIFCPGYVTSSVLFPDNQGLDWIERLAISLGLSVVVVPALGLLLWTSGLGLRLVPILAFLAAYTNGAGLVALARRQRLPIDRRLSFTLEFGKQLFARQALLDKALTLATVASLLLAIGVLAYVTVIPRPADHFTEFYLTGAPGDTYESPTRLNASQPALISLWLVNHEGSITAYQVRVDLVGLRTVFNTTSGTNQTSETNRTTLGWLNITVEQDHNWTEAYEFTISTSGLWKVHFVLYKEGDLTTPYRELGLFVLIGGG